MKQLLFLFLSISLFTTSIEAKNTVPSPETYRWGPTGHRVVGEVATSYLTCRAKKKIRKILGNESVAISSNWADFIKSDTAMKYIDQWHYINLKSGLTYADFAAQLQKDTFANAFTKLNFMINQLKNKQLPLDKQQMYLKLIIHIVGDIHQPLHVGHAEDLGGNKIKVMWFNEPTNLHALWDDKIVEFQKLSYTEFAKNINHTEKQQRKTWQKQAMSEWLFESYQLAEGLYKGISQPDQKLSYRYNYDNVAILNSQLLKGGVRLAGVLNEIFR